MIENYKVYEMNRQENLFFHGMSSLILFALAFLYFNSFILGLICSLLQIPSKKLYKKILMEKRKKLLLLQFKDALYSISASIATGKQMGDSLADAEKSVGRIYGKGCLLEKELNYMVKKIFDAGENDEYVLKDFGRRTDIKEIISFADIYTISKKTGADFQRVIRKTVEVLLDRIEIEREMRALTSQKRFEFAILTAMPPIIIIFLRITSPSYLIPMYGNLGGNILMALSLFALIIAAYMAWEMTRVK